MVPLHAGEPYRLNMETSLPNLHNVITARETGGHWRSYPQVFETTGVECIRDTIRRNRKILLLDELGHIEMEAPSFQREVFRALDCSIHALGVIKNDTNPFLKKIKNREDTECIFLLPGFQKQIEDRIRLFLHKVMK